MSTYSILNIKQDLTGVLHGTTTDEIQGLDNLINRAARQLLLDVDPQETKRTVEFTSPIFNSVTDYAIPADVKGNKLIDIKPQVKRIPRDVWTQSYNQAFDIAKENLYLMANQFTINFNTGIKTIRINAPFLNAPVVLNQAESITDNGTWVVGGNASGLSVDNTNYVQGSGSLKFNTTVGASTLTNSTQSAVDLTAHLNQSSLFAWVYVPIGSALTSVQLKWGSDASNYYTRTVTVTQASTAFQNGWNLCQFNWAGCTVVGSPNVTAIDYVQVTLNTTVDMAGCHINGIDSTLGTILECEYYSKYLFRDSATGAFQETVTDDSNLINLDTDSYNLLFFLVAAFAMQQQQGVDASYDGTWFGNQYVGALQKYKSLYKSELQKPQSTYYRTPDVSNRRFLGRRFNY